MQGKQTNTSAETEKCAPKTTAAAEAPGNKQQQQRPGVVGICRLWPLGRVPNRCSLGIFPLISGAMDQHNPTKNTPGWEGQQPSTTAKTPADLDRIPIGFYLSFSRSSWDPEAVVPHTPVVGLLAVPWG